MSSCEVLSLAGSRVYGMNTWTQETRCLDKTWSVASGYDKWLRKF